MLEFLVLSGKNRQDPRTGDHIRGGTLKVMVADRSGMAISIPHAAVRAMISFDPDRNVKPVNAYVRALISFDPNRVFTANKAIFRTAVKDMSNNNVEPTMSFVRTMRRDV